MIPERYARYEKVVTVGAVNFRSAPGDKAANLEKIEANVREAASQGVDIVAFPEEALIGAGGCDACSRQVEHCDYHHDLAETVPGPSSERIAELARELGIYVVFGLAERDANDSEALYNAAAFVGPEGIQGTYRKLHLGSLPWVTEGVTFRPGNALPVFETRFGPVGVIICYDFWFNPELTRLLALKGARVILNCCATFAGPGKREYMTHTTATRAQENLCYVASANQVRGPDSSGSYGTSAISPSTRSTTSSPTCDRPRAVSIRPGTRTRRGRKGPSTSGLQTKWTTFWSPRRHASSSVCTTCHPEETSKGAASRTYPTRSKPSPAPRGFLQRSWSAG